MALVEQSLSGSSFASILVNVDDWDDASSSKVKDADWGEAQTPSFVKTETTKEVPPKRASDPVLEKLGGSFSKLDDQQFLAYFCVRFEEVYGRPYRPQRNALQIIKGFRRRWQADAGPMVQLFFDRFKGRNPRTNEPETITAFCEGSGWIQDILYAELTLRRKSRIEAQRTGKMMKGKDFIDMFKGSSRPATA